MYIVLSFTIFVENKAVIVSAEELRKLKKKHMVDLAYDLLMRVGNSIAEVHVLKEESKDLKEEG